jgi:HEAT repeat protein
MSSSSDFQDYLQSLCTTYEYWWKENAFIDEIKDDWFEFVLDGKSDKQTGNEDVAGEQRQEITKPILRLIKDYQHQKTLLVGSPGAGKTTLLKKLLRDAAQKAQEDDQAPIPVFIELKDYGTIGDRPGVRRLILESLESHDPALDEEALKQLLVRKRLLLLADGLNESSNKSAKTELKKLCRHQAVIATSRFENDWWDIDDHRKLEIQPLTPKQVKQFLEERLPNQDRVEVEKLGDRVKDFGQTPLMIWMLYTIFQANKATPKTRGEVYRSFTALYVERAKAGIDLAESRFLLSKLAFEMMQSQKPDDSTHFRLDITEVDAQNHLGSATILNQLLDLHLLQASGNPGNRKIRFCHQTLQEYYAAEALLEQLQKYPKWLEETSDQQWTRFQQDYLNYLKWTEAIALMFGLPEITDNRAKQLVKLSLSTDLMMGARLAGEVKLQLQEQVVELVSKVRSVEQTGISDWLHVELLGRTRSKLALPKLQSFLRNSNLDIACRAATWLGFLAYQEAIPDLLQMLSELDRWIPCRDGSRAYSDRTLSLHIEIIEALGKLSPKDAISELRKVFHNSASFIYSFNEHRINKLLKQYDLEFTTQKSLETLKKSKDSNQISQAAKLLFELGCPESPLIIVSRLNCEQDAEIHQHLIDALSPFNTPEVISTLSGLILNPDRAIREKAAKALIKYERVDAIDSLIPHLKHSDWNIVWCAAVILGKLSSNAAAPTLLDGLTNQSPRNIRITAAEALGKLKSDETIDALRTSLQDLDYAVRRTAAISLGYFNQQEAIPELLKALQHYYPSGDSYTDIEIPFELDIYYTPPGIAPETLAQLGDEEAIRSWIDEKNSKDIREKVADALGNFNTEEVIDGLFKSLRKGIKVSAVPLGRFGKQEVVSELLELLIEDSSNHVSSINKVINTLVHLISLGNLSIVSKLLSILKNIKDYQNADFYLRNRAGIVLTKAEHTAMPHYTSELVTLLSSEVVEQASWAIAAIQSRCGFYNYEIYQYVKQVESDGNFISQFYKDIDKVIYQIQKNPELRQKDGEDRLTIEIVGALRSSGYNANHDCKNGGHVDLAVEKDDFIWLGEAKIYRDNNYLWEGFQQLTTRYSTGDTNQNSGGLLIYILKEDAKSIMKKWQEYLRNKNLPEYSCEPCKIKSSAFISSHRHEGSGQLFHVRHVPVLLHFAPKDKSGRGKKATS